MNEELKKMAEEVVEKIVLLPNGSEFTFGDYFKNYNIEGKKMFELTDETLKLCNEKGINIENTQARMSLGMPWVFKYKKNN